MLSRDQKIWLSVFVIGVILVVIGGLLISDYSKYDKTNPNKDNKYLITKRNTLKNNSDGILAASIICIVLGLSCLILSYRGYTNNIKISLVLNKLKKFIN